MYIFKPEASGNGIALTGYHWNFSKPYSIEIKRYGIAKKMGDDMKQNLTLSKTIMKLVLILFLAVLTSCTSEENLKLQVNSKYQGDYTGVYSGDISGDIIFNVSDTGSLEGTVYYGQPSNTSESISGYVMIDGKFNASTKSNFTFLGYLHSGVSKGKWSKNNLKGDYNFYKK